MASEPRARSPSDAELRGRILDTLDDPVLLIDEHCTVLYGNAAATRVLLAKAGLEVRGGRLAGTTSSDDARLEQAVVECGRSWHMRHYACKGLRVSRQATRGTWLVLVSPLLHANFRADAGVFVVHLVSRVHPRNLPSSALRDLFGLTRRELEVISGLLRRESLRDIARRLSLSHETVRVHVKRILGKCDVRSQIQLLALLQRVSLFAGKD